MMIPEMLQDVQDFQERILGLETPSKPQLLVDHRFNFAKKFLQEELNEFEEAHHKGDLPEATDALVDLIYVALGRLIEMGVPPGPVFQEVHKKNMLKFKGKTKRGHNIDAAKPEDWTPPDHSWLLDIDEHDVANIKQRHEKKHSDGGVVRDSIKPPPYLSSEYVVQQHQIPTNRKLSEPVMGKTEYPGIACADKKNPLAKPQTALIPYEALAVEAEAAGYGAYVKYTPWNWLGGRSYTEVLSSIDHHLRAWSEHEIHDPESKCHHLGHARIDIAFLIVWEKMGLTQFDDRRPVNTITYHQPGGIGNAK